MKILKYNADRMAPENSQRIFTHRSYLATRYFDTAARDTLKACQY
jgi:hypothetical protein